MKPRTCRKDKSIKNEDLTQQFTGEEEMRVKRKRKRMINFMAGLLFIGIFCLNSGAFGYIAPSEIYVDHTATGLNDGSSWANAYTDLQDGLSAASSGALIYVAEGTYYPTTTTTRTISFAIPSGVEVYGGYPSGGGTRDRSTSETILSGDIGTGGDVSDNSRHIVTFSHVNDQTILDGFTITKGNASADPGSDNYPWNGGGGIYIDGTHTEIPTNTSSNPRITNCTITENSAEFGGGIYNNGTYGEAIPSITNCIISENNATRNGAGMFSSGFYGISNAVITNCVISGNYAEMRGGGMYNYGESGTCSSHLINCFISGNRAVMKGGGIHNNGRKGGISSPIITNCTISGNNANGMSSNASGGTSNPSLTNCIIYGNGNRQIYNQNGATPTYNYCNVAGGVGGTGNINSDPLFVDEPDSSSAPTTDGDLHLQPGSPCIDAGNNSAYGLPSTDFDGDNRKIDDPVITDTGNGTAPIVDMGADEVSNSAPLNVTTQAVTAVNISTATGNGNITDLGTANPTQHGVCWSTSENPTTDDDKTEEGAVSETGAFTSSITGLSAGTAYYVRAYATNSEGTSYGDQVSFTTQPQAPTSIGTTENGATNVRRDSL